MTLSHRLAVAFLPVACLWLAVDALPSAAAQQEEQPAAVVGGEPLYEKDYIAPVEAQLIKLRQEEYDLRLKALQDEITKRLVHAEAERQGLTENQYLGQEVDIKVPAPSNEEIEKELVARMFGGSGTTDKDEIADELWQKAVYDARDELYLRLQAQAGVKIHLLPPRVPVSYDKSRVRGSVSAPVTLIEFADFHCPFCGQMYSVIKQLLAEYNGKVMLGYRDLPLQEVPDEFIDSPEAARCAGEQGKFWEFHDLLFEHQDQFSLDAFKRFAASLQLNAGDFAACLESHKYKDPIEADFQEGMRLGATGTPYFFINGIPLAGAHPLADFEEIINLELAPSKTEAPR